MVDGQPTPTGRIEQGQCKACGGPIKRPRAGKVGRFCSARCRRDGAAVRICGHCGKRFGSYTPQTNCSLSCAQKARNKRRGYRPAQCRVCGSSFRVTKSNKHFCSWACVAKHSGHRQSTPAQREYWRRQKQRRKARKMLVIQQPYTEQEIFERDRWKCGICGKRVSAKKVAPHPKSPTIDHVIPLTKGGADAPYNVQCGHYQCNVVKNVKTYVLF